MKFVGNTIFPSQWKRNVLGTTAELETLLPVLYHELVNTTAHGTAVTTTTVMTVIKSPC